jgi:hypothetical protein
VKREMLSSKKVSVSAVVLSTLLLTSLLLLGVVQGSTDFAVSTQLEFFGKSDSVMPVSSNQTIDLSHLFINEFMADNGITVAGPNGNSPDWIELFNAGNKTIDLTGMYLTDDLTDPTCWQFPEGTTIGPSEYLLVWADRDGGEIYASFGLNANGEEIGLFDSDGETLIDSVQFVKQIQDVSYGRIPDGGSSWNYLLSATPGFSNQDPSVEAQSSVWSLVLLIVVFLIAGVSIFLASKIRTRKNK